jgi:cysteine synthase A
MGCTAVAILPEQMSRERFEWLREIGAEVIATPGCESNVKEIYDKCWEIRAQRPDCVIFNQFDEFGNPCWHYHNTGAAVEEVFRRIAGPGAALAAYVSSTGSAGTIAAGDYLRSVFPALKVVAAEARQCPTLLQNGFGGHRIEGIGDKHVPWVHNVRNTDAVAAVDDEDCMRLFRLFNEPAGRERLRSLGLEQEQVAQLELLGISGIANVLAAVKTAKHFDLGGDDIVFSLATDSAAMYASRLQELAAERGAYAPMQAAGDLERCLWGQEDDHFKELTYSDRKAVHNLKYFTWVEQQGKEIADLNQLWHDREIWPRIFGQVGRWDEMIREFNERTGLLKSLA